MKYTLFGTIAIVLLIVACQPSENNSISESLEEKKVFLSKLKSQQRDLNNLIEETESQIKDLEPSIEKDPIPVVSQKIELKEFKRYLTVQANVKADEILNVSSEIGGRLTSLRTKEGQYVKRGQLIATTDMVTVENQISEIETSLDLANIVFERQKRLWEQNIGSEIQYLESKNNKERLEKTLSTAKSQLSKGNIYAPSTGIVDKKFLSNGELAAPGAPIIQILNTNKVKITADLQESLLGKIKKGDKVEVYFPAIGKSYIKPVTQIGRSIDMANRTFEVEIASSSDNGILKPNLLAEVSINDYTKADALVIPLDIVKEEVSGDKFIYLIKNVDNKERAIKTYLTLGESAEGSIVVESGINPGDMVVISGSENLSNNDPVINSVSSSASDE